MCFLRVDSRGQSVLIRSCFRALQSCHEAGGGEAAADEKPFLMLIEQTCYVRENRGDGSASPSLPSSQCPLNSVQFSRISMTNASDGVYVS